MGLVLNVTMEGTPLRVSHRSLYFNTNTFFILALIFLGLGLGASCFAAEETSNSISAIDHLSALAQEALAEKLSSPDAKAEIKFPSIEKLARNPNFIEVAAVKEVHLIDEKANGIATFAVNCATLNSKGQEQDMTKIVHLPYEAWIKVPVATHRIYPNTKLKAEDFKVQAVNIATGMAREYRGIFASPNTQFDKVQAKQSILEGQFLTTVALQREPDVRRGETVKLELISGELSLTTQGVAQEQGAIGDRIRVLSAKTKKEISGRVREDHSVEVKL